MDAFFASVTLLRYPQLQGLPVVIGGSKASVIGASKSSSGSSAEALTDDSVAPESLPLEAFTRLRDYRGRGVITTATYAARQFGVGSAMGLQRAARLCPQAILLPVDFAVVKDYSNRFKDAVRRLAPVLEDRGIDEVFVDISAQVATMGDAGECIAAELKQAIFEATGLTCSIGVAPNKLIAKMASEFNKPDGISVVMANEVAERIGPLPCKRINGIGPKTAAKLTAMGYERIEELAQAPLETLQLAFGEHSGRWLFDASHGHDERPVQTRSEPVSMSREMTFARDLSVQGDRAELSHALADLCQRVADDLQRKGRVGRCISIKIRYADFRSVTRDQTITEACDDAETIRHWARQCLKRVPLEQRIRLLGVKVGQLSKVAAELPELLPTQLSLLELVDGAVYMPAAALPEAAAIWLELQQLFRLAPPRRHMTKRGFYMASAMTAVGSWGWISDRRGYRYVTTDPETGQPWPAMPELFRRLAQGFAAQAGYPHFQPDSCMINDYAVGAGMGLHQDRDESDLRAPIVSVSLGLPVAFQFGGKTRQDGLQRLMLCHGDVVVWGGETRLNFHGVLPLKAGQHSMLGARRINLTFRMAHAHIDPSV
jgi:DNA polymerase-4